MLTLIAKPLVGYGSGQKQVLISALPRALFRIGGLRKENIGAFRKGISGRGRSTSPAARLKQSQFCWRAPPIDQSPMQTGE
jgi:hypothetical protein